VRIFEAAGREVKPRMQTRTVQPTEVQNASLTGAGRLHPAQCFRASAAIVGGEEQVPKTQRGYSTTSVNNQEATHDVSLSLFL
jgi:hypothetical protein